MTMVSDDSTIVVYGAGAVGSCVGGWLGPIHSALVLVARGQHAAAMRSRGVTLLRERPPVSETVPVQVVESLDDCAEPQIILLTVKNYELEAAAQDIQRRYGDGPFVIGLQNGLANQAILPRYFSRTAYGVIWFGAWRPEPGRVSYERRGPISLGLAQPDGSLAETLGQLNDLFGRGFQSEIAGDFQAAVRTKMILNLTNSLMTLVGHGYRPIAAPGLLKRLTTGMLLEGIRIVKAEGFSEYTRGGNPSWLILRLLARLPDFITDRIFEQSLADLKPNSMAQDILQHRKGLSELDSLNGYFVAQAHKLGIPIPFIDTVTELGGQHFGRPDFEPIPEKEIWDRVRQRIKSKERSV